MKIGRALGEPPQLHAASRPGLASRVNAANSRINAPHNNTAAWPPHGSDMPHPPPECDSWDFGPPWLPIVVVCIYFTNTYGATICNMAMDFHHMVSDGLAMQVSVNIVVAHALAPNWCQGMCSHNVDQFPLSFTSFISQNCTHLMPPLHA